MEKNNYRLELYINGRRYTNREYLLSRKDITEDEAVYFAQGVSHTLHMLGKKKFYIDVYRVNADDSETYITRQM